MNGDGMTTERNHIGHEKHERRSGRATCFEKLVPNIGTFSLRPLQLPDDMPKVHGWVTREYAKYWGLQNKSVQEVEAAYEEILRPPRSRVFIGLLDGQPVFLLEAYHPSEDPIGKYYDVHPGDHGMHILVAPTDRPIHDFTWHAFTVVMDFLFDDGDIERIVVEPDVRNEKIHALNRRAGFQYQKIVQLPKKTAYLAFCTREQYRAALARGDLDPCQGSLPSPRAAGVAHLTPGIWTTVNALHVRKVLSEFSHELLLRPRLEHVANGWGHYVLATDGPDIEYRFRGRLLNLEHWHIDAASIEKYVDGSRAPLDSVRLVLEIRETIGLSLGTLPSYMEELTSTLYSSAYKHANQRFDAAELAHASFQDVETGMTEGHPSFVANNGRIGFDVADHEKYAPEAGSDVRLIWIAVHKARASFASISQLSYRELVLGELGASTVDAFHDTLRRQGLDPDTYLFMPVHPWQWENKLARLFASDIALQRLVFLGQGADAYRAQQSVRTFFNTSYPGKHYVKTALSVLNMGFVRGLSPKYMETTPAINEWVHALIEGDPYLRESGFAILREVASVAYRHSDYEAGIAGDSPYKKMLAALWRESPVPRLRAGQRLMTMASLLHRDRDGMALLPELVRSSGIDADDWLRRYLRCYLTPLLHCFYAHDLVFMPHGENLILVLEGDVPVRAFMKDIGEEVAVLDGNAVLPEKVRRISVSVPEELKLLSIFTDVFDGIFRFVAEVLLERGVCPEDRFWQLVAECVVEYQRAHPAFAAKFRRFDLFSPEFRRSCLNRLQIANNQQLLDLTDPAKSLRFAGTLENPIGPFKPAVAVAGGQ